MKKPNRETRLLIWMIIGVLGLIAFGVLHVIFSKGVVVW